MANNINFNVGFNTDISGLQEAQRELQKIKDMSLLDYTKEFKAGNFDSKEIQKEFNQIKKSASELEGAFTRAFNPKLNTLNIQKFNSEIAKSDRTLDEIYDDMAKLGPQGANAFRNMTVEVLTSNQQLKQTQNLLTQATESLIKTGKWFLSSSIINRLAGDVQESIGYVKALDSSLNDIRIVTGASADEMDKFAIKANKAAKSLGAATTDYTNAALIYRQQGLGEEETAARTETTLKMQNVTGLDASQASEYVTSIVNGYQVATEGTEAAIDKLAGVAAMSASSLEELATGMSKVASAASTMGVTEDQLVATMSTIISVTRQAPESVGTALKTIYARMGDLKLGETDEDGVQLGEVSGQLSKIGVEVLDANGNMRDMGTIVEETANKWQGMSQAEKEAVAVALAGKRQYNNLFALFENWDKYQDALNASENSLGTLQRQQDIYMDSAEAHLQKMKTSTEGVYDSLLDADSIKLFADIMNGVAIATEKFIDSIGGGTGAFSLLFSVLTHFGKSTITNEIVNMANSFGIGAKNVDMFAQSLQLVNQLSNVKDEGIKEIVSMYNQIKDRGIELTATQKEELEILANLTKDYANQKTEIENKIKEETEYLNILKEERDTYAALVKAMTGQKVDSTKKGYLAELDANKNEKDFSNRLKQANAVNIIDKNKVNELSDINISKTNLTPSKGYVQKESLNEVDQLKQKLIEIDKILKDSGEKGILDDELLNQDISQLRTVPEEFEKVKAKLLEIKENFQFASSFDSMTSLVEQFNQMENEMDEITISYDELKNSAKSFISEAEKTGLEGTPILKEFKAALENIEQQEVDSETKAKLLSKTIEELGENIKGIVKEGKNNIDSTAIDETEHKLSNLKNKFEQVKNSMASIKQEFSNFAKAIDFSSMVNSTVSAAQGISSMAMSFSSAKSAWDALTNEDMSWGEKIIQTSLGASMAITSFISGLKSLGNAISLAKKTMKSMEMAEIALMAASATNTIVVNKESDAELKNIAAKVAGIGVAEIEKGTEVELTAEKIKEAVATNKLSEEEGKLALSRMGASTAGKKGIGSVLSSLGKMGPHLILIMALIASIGLYIYERIYKPAHEAEIELKKQKETLENLNEVSGQLAESFNEVNSALDSIAQHEETLKTLTEGTEEWKNEIAATNEEILKLINIYPELAAAVKNVDGHLTLDTESDAYKDFKKKQSLRQNATSEAAIEQNREINITENKIKVDDLNEDIAHIARNTFQENNSYEDDAAAILTQELNKGIDYFKLASEAYQKNNNLFTQGSTEEENIQKLQKSLGLKSEYLAEAIYNMSDKIVGLNNSIEANTQAQSLQAKNIVSNYNEANGVEFENGEQVEDFQADYYLKKIDSYKNTYADTKGDISDEKANAEEYAELMGLSVSKVTGKETIFSQTNLDGTTTEVTLDDESIRLILAQNKAKEDALNAARNEDRAITNAKNDLEKNGKVNTASADILSNFRKGKDFDLSSLTTEQLEQFQRDFENNKNNLKDIADKYGINLNAVTDAIDAASEKIKERRDGVVSSEEASQGATNAKNIQSDYDSDKYVTPDSLKSDESYMQLKDSFEDLKSQVPELENSINILNDSSKYGTEEWLNALNQVSDAYDMISMAEDGKITGDELAESGIKSISELEESVGKATVAVENYDEALFEVSKIEAENLGLDKDELKDTEKLLIETNKELSEYPGVVKSTAVQMQKLDKNMANLSGNTDKWYKKLKNAKKGTYEYAEGLEYLKENTSGIFGDNGLTNLLEIDDSFVDDNLQLFKDFSAGVEGALNQLRQKAAQTFLVDIKANADTDSANDAINDFQSVLDDTDLSVEGQAFLEDSAFVQALNNMIAQTGMSVDDVNKMLSGMGVNFDYKLKTIPVTTIKMINGIPAKVTEYIEMPEITAATTSGGGRRASSGGGGGGGGSKPSTSEGQNQEAFEDDIDIYHQINTQIDKTTAALERLQNQQEKLSGKNLLNNIKAQIRLNQQLVNQQTAKLKLQQKEAQVLKTQLLSLDSRLKLNKDGTIGNYDQLLSQRVNEINAKIEEYNALYGNGKELSEDQQKAAEAMEKEIERMKESYQDLKDMMDQYDEMISQTIADTKAAIAEAANQEIQLKIDAFSKSIEIKLEINELKRELNEFVANVTNVSLKYGKDLIKDIKSEINGAKSYVTGNKSDYNVNVQGYKRAQADFNAIQKGKTGKVYGNDAAAALEAMKQYAQGALEALQNAYDAVQSLKEGYIDFIDTIGEAYDEQKEQYDYINSSIEHQINLIQKIKGENAYDDLDKAYNAQIKNSIGFVDMYKQQVAFYDKIVVDYAKRFGTDSEQYKAAIKAQQEAKANLESSIDEALEYVQVRFENTIDKISNKWATALATMNPEVLSAQWENYKAEETRYLDPLSRTYQVGNFSDNVKKEIDKTDNVRFQQELNNLLNEEIARMEKIDKLSQNEVDYANLRLQLKLKELALEEAKENKTKMRLKRDSQGNYSYVYTADEDNIAKAQEEYKKAAKDLYDRLVKDKQTYEGEYVSTTNNFAKEYAEIAKRTDLSEEDRAKLLNELKEKYAKIFEDIKRKEESLTPQLKDAAVNFAISMGEISEDFWNSLTDDEKAKYYDKWIGDKLGNTAAKSIKESIASGDFMGYLNSVIDDTDKAIDEKAKAVNEIGDAAGIDNLADTDTAITNLAQSTQTLTDSNKELATNLDKTKGSLDKLYKSMSDLIKFVDGKGFQNAIKKIKSFYSAVNNANSTNASALNTASYEQISQTVASYIHQTNGTLELNDMPTLKAKSKSYSDASLTNNPVTHNSQIYGKVVDIKGDAVKLENIGWVNKKDLVKGSFDTGGYTGEWDDRKGGRLAMLHSKELVLNKYDTSNFLKALQIMRDLYTEGRKIKLQEQIQTQIKGLTSVSNNNEAQELNQNVKIEANFPNVRDASEIERALNNLVNTANQYIWKN